MLVFRNVGCAVPSAAVSVAPAYRCLATGGMVLVAWGQAVRCSWCALHLKNVQALCLLAEKFCSQAVSGSCEPLPSPQQWEFTESQSSFAVCLWMKFVAVSGDAGCGFCQGV